MAGDLSFEKRTKMGACFVLLCSSSVCITSLLDMAINLQLIIKITRSFESGFQSKDCKARCQTNHDWKQKSKADIDVRSYRELLICETTTHHFFLFVVICLLRYYVYIFYVTRTILGLTFLHPDTIETDFLFLFIRIWDTYYARVGCC